LHTVADGIRSLGERAKFLRLIAASTAAVVGGVAAFRRRAVAEPAAKPSRFQSILKGAGLISSLWMALGPRDRERERS
jgi:hypothetical protein